MSDEYFWPNLGEPIALSATSGQCNKVVENSTIQIRECLTRLTSLLHERALALLKCAQFDTALRDADAIQELDPRSTLSDLLKGEIYAHQGRHKKVLEAYDEGLEVNGDDQQLLKAKAEAETMNEKRVDFISKLPLDIVAAYIVPLVVNGYEWSARYPCPYLYVSNTWRDRFSRASLRYLFNDHGNDGYPAQALLLLHRVQSLRVLNYKPGSDLASLLHRGHFVSLRSMEMNETEPSNGYVFVCPRQTGSHLEDLRITSQAAALRMVDVLESCPKLVCLKLSCAVKIDLVSQPWQLSPALVHLELSHLRTPILREHVLALQKHCPSLGSLALHPCHDSTFLPHLHQHWPAMKQLLFSTQRRISWNIDWKAKPNTTPPGLRTLYIDDLDVQHYNPHDIHNTVVNNCETLETMFLAGNTHQEFPPPPPTVQFTRLKRLYYWTRPSPLLPCHGSWIPSHAPVLEGVDLNHGALAGSPALVNILCSLPHLRSLAYHSSSGCSTASITKVLKAHANMENGQSCLVDLILAMPANLIMHKSFQEPLGELKNITGLSLGRAKDTMNATYSKELFMLLAKHFGALRVLDIKMKTDGLDDGVLILSTLGNLQSMALRGDQLSNTGLLYLTRYSKLQDLTLYNTTQTKLASDLQILGQHNSKLRVHM